MAYDEFDQAIRERLRNFSPKYERLRQLRQLAEAQKEAYRRQYETDNADLLTELAQLEEEYKTTYEQVTLRIREVAMSSTRRQFMDGTVLVQQRVRVPAQYNRQALLEWAKPHPQLLTVPKKDTRWLSFLQEKAPELLIIDEAKAAQLAIETYEDGSKVYPNSPINPEPYITQPSEDTFSKVMTRMAIELKVDAQEADDDSAQLSHST